jgi:hypothetical protein
MGTVQSGQYDIPSGPAEYVSDNDNFHFFAAFGNRDEGLDHGGFLTYLLHSERVHL